MGCIHNGYDGVCQLWLKECSMPGADENGICVVDDDECPDNSCDSYESNGDDWRDE